MTAEQLSSILADHKKWLRGDGGSRANLYGANLTSANLTRANLTRANLTSADLTSADLTDAKSGAFLITRQPLAMYGCRYAVAETFDGKICIGCERDVTSAALPMLFDRHCTPPQMRELYTQFVQIIERYALEHPLLVVPAQQIITPEPLAVKEVQS